MRRALGGHAHDGDNNKKKKKKEGDNRKMNNEKEIRNKGEKEIRKKKKRKKEKHIFFFFLFREFGGVHEMSSKRSIVLVFILAASLIAFAGAQQQGFQFPASGPLNKPQQIHISFGNHPRWVEFPRAKRKAKKKNKQKRSNKSIINKY